MEWWNGGMVGGASLLNELEAKRVVLGLYLLTFIEGFSTYLKASRLITQARTQPLSKGGYILIVERGGGGGGGVRPLPCTVTTAWGVWGHAPPENFGNLDSPRTFLRHSDSHLGADLASSIEHCHLLIMHA